MTRREIVSILVVWTLGLGPTTVHAGDSILTFASDPSWQAFSVFPDGGQGDALGGGQCVCYPAGCPCCWTGNTGAIPGACWVWKPGTTPSTIPVDLVGMYLRKTLDVPGYPDAGALYVAADDFAEVTVNDVVVRSIGSVSDYGSAAGAQAQLTQVNITPFLLPGLNDIVIYVQNGPGAFTGTNCNPCTFGQNPTGVIFGGTISYFAAVPNRPSSWGRVKTIYR